MIIRPFNGSQSDLEELMAMYVDLYEFDYDKNINHSYAEKIGELYKSLYQHGAVCNLVIRYNDIIGFMILFPDKEGGMTAQSLYLKQEYRKSHIAGRLYKWLENWISDNYKYCTIIATTDKVCKMYDKRYKKLYSVYKFIPKGA